MCVCACVDPVCGVFGLDFVWMLLCVVCGVWCVCGCWVECVCDVCGCCVKFGVYVVMCGCCVGCVDVVCV